MKKGAFRSLFLCKTIPFTVRTFIFTTAHNLLSFWSKVLYFSIIQNH